MILELLNALPKLPEYTRLGLMLQRAANGDPEAVAYCKGHWSEFLDLLKPGAGTAAIEVQNHLRQAVQNINQTMHGNIIEGEFTEVTSPWLPFVKRLLHTGYGPHVIIGPPGQGKTTFAKRMAQRYMQELGYTVECVAMYGDDLPSFAVPIAVETLMHRTQKIKAHVRTLGVRDPDEVDDDDEDKTPVSLPPTRRVIIIDEASVSSNTNANSPERNAAFTALGHCRHVDWVVIFIAQFASMLPQQAFAQSVLWVKRPVGNEQDADRDNRLVRELWRSATEAFEGVRTQPEWSEYPDVRAWSYCSCESFNGGPGYKGLVPFSQPEESE